MTALLVGWPIVMVLVVNNGAPESTTLTLVLVQLSLVLALQSLGTVRASQSWAAKVNAALQKQTRAAENGAAPRAATAPSVTFGFNARAVGNWIAVALLLYDFFQVSPDVVANAALLAHHVPQRQEVYRHCCFLSG